MAKSHKKYAILGGVKASSQQLAEWGSMGGRPRKWKNEAERKRFARQQQKTLRPYRSYGGEAKTKKLIICPHCSKVDQNLWKYFDKQGKFIERKIEYRGVNFDIRVDKGNNYFVCQFCSYAYSFKGHGAEVGEQVEVIENQTIIFRAGKGSERNQRSQNKK